MSFLSFAFFFFASVDLAISRTKKKTGKKKTLSHQSGLLSKIPAASGDSPGGHSA